MNLEPIYKTYVDGARIVIFALNVVSALLLIKAFDRHREQRGFLLLGISCLGFAFSDGYHMCARFQHQLAMEIFPFWIWRVLAYVFFTVDPIAIILSFLGIVVLIRTYGRAPIRSASDSGD